MSVLPRLALVAALTLAPVAAAAEEIVVFAAASLKTALDTVATAWAAEAGHTATISYAASSALARQIEAGAPADVVLSADVAWMDHLAARGLIAADTRADLLGNRLVLIGPAGAADIAVAPGFALATALGGGRLAMADVAAVPAGKYGRAALESLGVWTSVEGSLAQAENVRAALALVARGEAPLGIVYATDAMSDPAVRIVGTFPEDSHPPIIYPVAVTARATSAAARDFVAYLGTAAPQAVFEEQGFTVLQ